jgi:hypothetical protein
LVINIDNKERLERRNILTTLIKIYEHNYITSVQASQKPKGRNQKGSPRILILDLRFKAHTGD